MWTSPEKKVTFKSGKVNGPYQLVFLTHIPFLSSLWLLCDKGGSEDDFTEASPRMKLTQRKAKMRQRQRGVKTQ